MRHYLPAAALALAFAACSDDYDDSALWDAVNGNTQRIEALEAWQAEVNNNIAALQQLLNTNDMITAVTPVTMGGETVGYTLSFLHSDPVTIYNGTQGEKGEAGDTPQIGLTQGEDGNWYWTPNGGLMSDAEGNPIRANGEDGEDGEDGTDGDEGPQGPAGADAPTPEIKLGKNFPTGTEIDGEPVDATAWYLSVDEGETWHRVSGEDGKDGDSIFSGKPELSDDESYYIFTLSNGTEIKVSRYQDITLTFGNIDINTPIAVNNKEGLSIRYTVTGMDNAIVTAIPTDNSWTASVSDNILTVKAGTETECNLLVTATDNKGGSVSYTLSLYICDIDADGNYTVYNTTGMQAWATAARSELNTNCTLAADINLTGEWTPIGPDNWHQYTGTFNGDGHTISGLTVTGSDEYAGLFGVIGENGTVKNLKLTEVNIKGISKVGTVAGYNHGTITGCSAAGIVTGNSLVGGIIGIQNKGTIIGCHSSATVEGNGYVGGVVGYMETFTMTAIIACSSTGDVEAKKEYAGGVVGYIMNGTITACYATGKVTGSRYTGGVAGFNSSGTITACYWSGENTTGVGRGNTSGTTKVTDGNWTEAMNAMNTALSDTGWRYVRGTNGLPILERNQ